MVTGAEGSPALRAWVTGYPWRTTPCTVIVVGVAGGSGRATKIFAIVAGVAGGERLRAVGNVHLRLRSPRQASRAVGEVQKGICVAYQGYGEQEGEVKGNDWGFAWRRG